ncbi:MAG: molybdopterin-dependent oxidoreductase [Rhodobacteraceae bacterium]|nr:molybdopterin-dependent oxidoreductase [Paracoccaceae bacterium]
MSRNWQNRTQAFIAAVATVVALGLTAPAEAQQIGILTVTGNVENTNREAFDENSDRLFGYNDVAFDKAITFDAATLEKLPSRTVRAAYPMGGDLSTYEGPLLADVLKAAGAFGDKVTIQALDGYTIEAPLAEMLEQGAILAMKRNGEPFSIGDFGPTQIIFPRAERTELKDMPDDRWVWAIFHIRVE